MNIFKNYTFSWKQMGIVKLSLLSIGALAGAYWHEFLIANMTIVMIVAVVSTAYTLYVSLK